MEVYRELLHYDPAVPYVRFSDDAQELFDGWHTTNHERVQQLLSQSNQRFAAHLAKFPKLVPALALAFWVASGHPDGAVDRGCRVITT